MTKERRLVNPLNIKFMIFTCLCWAYSSTVKMEVESTYNMPLEVQRTKLQYMQEGN
jgi:hypothetical protein